MTLSRDQLLEQTGGLKADESQSLESYFEGLGLKTRKESRRKDPRPAWRRLLSLVLTFVLTVLLVLLIRQYVLQHNTVIGSSMVPALEDKDEIFIEKLSRLFPSGLKRGDIVTADTRSNLEQGGREYVIKRIVGLPGERITISEGYVRIDGQRLDEPYLDDWTLTDGRTLAYADLQLGEGQYYLLGDNRPNSRASRDLGPFEPVDIVGRLMLRLFPLDRMGKPK